MTDPSWPAPGGPQQPPPQSPGVPLPPPQNYDQPTYGSPQPPPHAYGAPQPPPNYGQPAYGMPPQAPKKRKIWPWILGIFGFIILGIGGCSYFVFGALAAPVDTSNNFLAEAKAQDYVGATELASKSEACFGADAQAVLTDFFSQRPITEYDLTSTNVQTSNGSSSAQVSGTIVVSGEQHIIGIVLTKESDEWRVCGIEIS